MGGYYAQAAGEPPEVARAIREHYRPRFASDELPSDLIGKAVAIADKLDTICGVFAIDEAPTGSSDPFAVRRAAIGTIAMLRTLPLVPLRALIDLSLDSYLVQGLSFDRGRVAGAVAAFFAGRLAAIVREEGAAPDVIEAVSSVGVIDPVEFMDRVEALGSARLEEPEVFEDLATAYARAAHLADRSLGYKIDEGIMGDAERSLLEACRRGSADVKKALSKRDYRAACKALADLREPIDRFFDDVLVMDDDTVVRENRLKLLNLFAAVFDDVANIGALSKKG